MDRSHRDDCSLAFLLEYVDESVECSCVLAERAEAEEKERSAKWSNGGLIISASKISSAHIEAASITSGSFKIDLSGPYTVK